MAFENSQVYADISNATGIQQLADILQHFFFALEADSSFYPKDVDRVVTSVRAVFDLSPSLAPTIVAVGKAVTLYPAGAELLDSELVNQPLIWLVDHPNVAGKFSEALKIYQSGDRPKYRNLLDNLRLGLEELLRAVLSNHKSLENQQEPLLPWLKEKGVHEQTVNMFNGLLFGSYRLFQNEAVKHSEKFSPKEIEFMIYLTGTFMRMLIQLSRG